MVVFKHTLWFRKEWSSVCYHIFINKDKKLYEQGSYALLMQGRPVLCLDNICDTLSWSKWLHLNCWNVGICFFPQERRLKSWVFILFSCKWGGWFLMWMGVEFLEWGRKVGLTRNCRRKKEEVGMWNRKVHRVMHSRESAGSCSKRSQPWIDFTNLYTPWPHPFHTGLNLFHVVAPCYTQNNLNKDRRQQVWSLG